MHIDLPSLGFCELAQGFFFFGGGYLVAYG